MSSNDAISVACFGKVPSRGDFVKSGGNHRMQVALDDWLNGAMQRFSDDPRWKINYDDAEPLHFAFLGSRRELAVAGHLVNSRDQSGRRFPFLAAGTLSVDDPLPFVTRSPLALSRLWSRMHGLVQELTESDDCTTLLKDIADMTVPVESDPSAYEGYFDEYLASQSLGSLQASLRASGHEVNLAALLPALGLLLQPVMASGVSQLDRRLVLPLPDDPAHRYPVAALWLDLIAPFLSRADFEISVFINAVDTGAVMLLGFDGLPEASLHAALYPAAGAEQNIVLDNPDWVDDHLAGNYGLRKLAMYLAQPEVTMQRARDTFREVFLGG